MDTEDMQRVVEITAPQPQTTWEFTMTPRAQRTAMLASLALIASAGISYGGSSPIGDRPSYGNHQVQVIDYRTIPPSTPTRRQRRRNRHQL